MTDLVVDEHTPVLWLIAASESAGIPPERYIGQQVDLTREPNAPPPVWHTFTAQDVSDARRLRELEGEPLPADTEAESGPEL